MTNSNGFKTHPLSDIQSNNIGSGTVLWQFCVVLPKARIGSNCNINAHVLIENDVNIGNNVTIKPGVQVWDGISIMDNVFIGPNATFTNDPLPRSKSYLKTYPKTLVETGASLGANCTILPGITIGKYALIGAGAVITKNVPDFAVIIGNPGKQAGYITRDKIRLDMHLRDQSNRQYEFYNNELRPIQ